MTVRILDVIDEALRDAKSAEDLRSREISSVKEASTPRTDVARDLRVMADRLRRGSFEAPR